MRFLTILCGVTGALGATSWIAPGAVWYDTDGQKIDAHGGGIVQRGDTFYWVGQSASSNESPMMYSSTDLLNWKNLGKQASSVTGLWRPKIAKPNGSFWLYGQQDRYVLSLKSAQMVGGYSTVKKVHLPPSDYSYSDTGMYYDEASTTWYLLTSADHNTVQINKINSDGTVGARASTLTGGAYEAPGLFYAGGVYFLIVSGKTGWRSNPNKVFTATSLSGPWTGGSNIAPESEKTYNSQNTYELTIKGSQQTTYLYMGDAWDSKGSTGSNYVWLPMAVSPSAKTVTLQYHAMWKVDVNTGVVSYPTAKKRYATRDAQVSRRASSRNSAGSSHKIKRGDEIAFHNVTGTGSRQWVSLLYTANEPEAGQAYIVVNDEVRPVNISDLNSRAGYHGVVPVQLVLKPGDVNTLRFGVSGASGFEVSVDGIEFYEED
ncbi:Arabinanase/levansucrase/invertase [Coniochaeta hoffmannii]|uniref:Arabinanase/levansucrase/invertase n=1 Tax=Coniochaeta hoffmannii TaxID=91930 RepID=A0AA38VYK3_9PEZI|nr:Arabinanase/levansucrase/invertase [Coniochaeta hoffmannii]